LDPRPPPTKIDVRVDGKANSRQDVRLTLQLVPRDTERLTEPQPRLDPAGAGLGAVVIDNAAKPLTTHLDLGTVREHRRVLERNAPLVVVPVGDPAPQLCRCELAVIHPDVEWVQIVVARSLSRQRCHELVL